MIAEINTLITNISTILIYFVPGYLLKLVSAIINLKTIEIKSKTIIDCVVTSYILTYITNYFWNSELLALPLAIVLAIVLYVIDSSKTVQNSLYKLKDKLNIKHSFHTDMLDALTRDKGGWVTYYNKKDDMIVIGQLIEVGSYDDGKRYIILDKYVVYDYGYSIVADCSESVDDTIMLDQERADAIAIKS